MNGHCTVIAAFPVAKAAINRLRSPRIFNDIGWLTEVMDGFNYSIFDPSAGNSGDANSNLMQSADGLKSNANRTMAL
jgi:hypothetical protein